MYLLIGVWGSGRKEYAAMKLTLMLMGGSAFLLIGILGIYYGAGAQTMNVLEIAGLHNIPEGCNGCSFLRCSWVSVCWVPCSRSIHGARTPRFRPQRCVHVACRGVDETGRIRVFPRGHVPDA